MKINKKILEFFSIVYYTIIFALVGIFLTEINDRYIINKFIQEDNEHLTKSFIRHLVETIIILITLMVITYYIGEFLVKLPFVLDVKGYETMRIITSLSILRIAIFLFSTGLRNKIKILNEDFLSNK